jgi:hypothetical protein
MLTLVRTAATLTASSASGPRTEGVTPPPRPNAEQAAQRQALADRLAGNGWSPGLCRLAAGAS